MPRVTIGLPVYNGERYLADALGSILAQSYTDFEVIIADNASTDNTQSICESYSAQDKRIRYTRNSHNLGAAPNFNLAFEQSASEYFKWAAHDDLIGVDYLERCVSVLDNCPSVVLCQTPATKIDEYGTSGSVYRYDADVHAAQPHQRFGNIALMRANLATPVFGVIRSEVLARTGLVGSYPASDEVLLAELALYGQFQETDEPLFYWRVHNRQSTQGEWASVRDRVAWFDTAAAHKITLHKWQYLFGYLRAIANAPLSIQQRAYCLAFVGRWLLRPDHIRALGKDVLLAGARSSENRFRRLAKTS